MKKLQEVLEVIKFGPFLKKYTTRNVLDGIGHRKAGIKTNPIDKSDGFTEKDKADIKEGLVKFIDDVKNVIEE